MKLRVCVAGVTGWVGAPLSKAISKATDLSLVDPVSRGANLGGTQIHSIRLPGFVIGVEAIFGARDERLIIRHEAGSGAEPYIEGTLLAIRKVAGQVGLTRGLDRILDAK